MTKSPPTNLQGSWIWYELITPDFTGAKAFYEAVVGWTFLPGTPETQGYGFVTNADGGFTGGVLSLTPEMAAEGSRPAWLGYIGVDDVDAAVAAIAAKGGKLLMPATDIPNAGRIAMVADCCGAPFYVMTPNMPEGAGPSTACSPMLPGRCAWNELQAGDQAAALGFYTALFGWTLPEPMDMGPLGKYQFIARNDTIAQEEVVMGAILPKMPQVPAPRWTHYFRVPNIDSAATAVRAHGGQLLQEPHEVPGGDWIIQGIDPQGAAFALVGNKAG